MDFMNPTSLVKSPKTGSWARSIPCLRSRPMKLTVFKGRPSGGHVQFNLIATLGVRCFYRNNFILCRAQKLEHVQDKLVLVSSIKKTFLVCILGSVFGLPSNRFHFHIIYGLKKLSKLHGIPSSIDG